MKTLPLGLRQVLESGDCVLFVGAGVGAHMVNAKGAAAPNASELATDMCRHFGIVPESTDLAKVAQLVELRKSRKILDDYIRRALSDLDPDEVLQWLTTFRWRAIFTTNYDRSIERAYELNGHILQNPVSISMTSEIRYFDPRAEVPIYHLHGSLFGEVGSHVVVTEKDYSTFRAQRKMMWERLRSEFATSTILYVGYSGRDPNWRLVLDELTEEFSPTPLPHSFRVDPCSEAIDIEILSARKIDTIELDLAAFRDLVDMELGDFRPDSKSLAKHEQDIPDDLRSAFEANPVSMLRLLHSWEYVQGASFYESPNTLEFLKGDKPKWSLVGADIPFARDAAGEIWDDILDFATSPTAKSRGMVLTAPAGWGITTLLMSLASQVVKARIGPAFMLRPNATVLEGDVNFAASLFPDVACFFFVDQAREQATAVGTSLYQQRLSSRNCLFVLGERRNEWRSVVSKPKHVTVYDLDLLSDDEIDRLLDYLAKEGALGKLAELDRPFQFAIVKEKHEKQLLIALRESVEGTNFDAIVEDEYRGIVDASAPDVGFARDLYMLVACFHQHGVVIRDELAATIVGLPLPEVYVKVGDSLEGVVQYEELDVARGEYGYRTRHRIIADAVWKRCGSSDKKSTILQSAIEKVNFLYKLDRDIFDKLVTSDAMVATFANIDGKIKFFETAAARDPLNPYVLQHFSRMLYREDRLALALAQIEAALKLKAEPHILHHTKGIILARLAAVAESDDVGRKYLHQAEGAFKYCMSARGEEGYSHSSLARSYLEWAKRCKNTDESTEYVTKAETAIAEGLRVVKDRQSLWIVSADIQKWLGNEPSRLAKLRTAVSEAKTSNIARYLLGRAYREDGQFDKAIEILDPIIRTEFSEFRVFVEYTRALLEIHESYKKCVAVLSQARVDGLSDPAYVALLGGLYFMAGETTQAQEVFAESKKQDFASSDRKKIYFRPKEQDAPYRPVCIDGVVAAVKPGFIFVRSNAGQELFCRATRLDGRILQKGDAVSFHVGFTPTGPIAELIGADA